MQRATSAAGILLLLIAGTGCKQLSDTAARDTRTSQTTTAPTKQTMVVTLPDPKRYGGPANFVTNPSFETGLKPWVPYNSSSLLRRTQGVHRHGHASARVIAAVPAPYGIQLPGVVGAPERGDAFRMSASIRSSGRPKKVHLILTAYGPGSSVQTVAQRTIVTGSKWERATVAGRIRGVDRNSLTATIVVLQSVGAGDSFLLDAVLLTSSPAP